jgi:insulysin
MMAVGKREEVEEIFKARTDKREYRRIFLKNSLQALLISDPDTDKAV